MVDAFYKLTTGQANCHVALDDNAGRCSSVSDRTANQFTQLVALQSFGVELLLTSRIAPPHN